MRARACLPACVICCCRGNTFFFWLEINLWSWEMQKFCDSLEALCPLSLLHFQVCGYDFLQRHSFYFNCERNFFKLTSLLPFPVSLHLFALFLPIFCVFRLQSSVACKQVYGGAGNGMQGCVEQVMEHRSSVLFARISKVKSKPAPAALQ